MIARIIQFYKGHWEAMQDLHSAPTPPILSMLVIFGTVLVAGVVLILLTRP